MARQKDTENKRETRQAKKFRNDPQARLRFMLKGRAITKLNTRGAAAKRKMIEDAGVDPMEVDKVVKALTAGQNPPKMVGSQKVSQKDRIEFSNDFRKRFWSRHANARCPTCKVLLKDVKRAIDHIIEWSKEKDNIETHEVCHSNVHWKVAFHDDVFERYHRPDNLQPMCKSCNSRKGGEQGHDTIAPVMLEKELCPGKNCTLPKAS